MKGYRLLSIIFILLILIFFVFILSITTGPAGIGFLKAIKVLFAASYDKDASLIILNVRLPRFLIGAIAGWSLSASGAVFQGLLRNPLADSYVLGVASGSAFGAVLSVFLGIQNPLLGIPLFSFLGAIIAILIVYYIARVDSKLNTGRMILAGVIVGTFFSAGVSLLLSIYPYSEMKGIIFWLLGDLSSQDMKTSMNILPYVFLGSVPLIVFSNQLNILSIGEEGAEQLGLNVKRSIGTFFVAGSLLTAAVVSACGVIGFVGLIIPHIIRLIFGPDHRILVPASGFCGVIFLVLCDCIARTVLSPAELPVGVITAFFGAPFFLYLLKWRRS